MRIIMAGASGFLGTSLGRHLSEAGHDVARLVRRQPSGPDQDQWDPAAGRLDPGFLEGADAVVNLAGAPIAHWPWTPSYKKRLLDSRLDTTGLIARTIAGMTSKPALVNASGVAYYGDRGDERLDEQSAPGTGFLCGVTRQWEAATTEAAHAGARVVIIRTGVVLHRSGGALNLMQWPFKLGVGGRLGSGQQFFPTISLTDYIGAVTMLTTGDQEGPFNVCGPLVATNGEFTRALGECVHRPTLLRVPSFAPRLLLGDLAQELLGSAHATPLRLMEAGYRFSHPGVTDQLRAAFAADA